MGDRMSDPLAQAMDALREAVRREVAAEAEAAKTAAWAEGWSVGRAEEKALWQARLRALELHADIRRNRFAIARGDKANDQATKGDRRQFRETPGSAGKQQESGDAFEKAAKALSADAGKPYRELGSKRQRWTVRGEVDLPSGKHLALERHDRVTLVPMPPGLDTDTGQKVMAGMKDGVAHVMRAVGIDR